MDEGNLPWEGYNSDSLYPGLAHPVRRSDIADALSAAGARVMHVQRALGRQMPDATHLITARFSSNARPRYFSQIVWPNNAYLTLYAVPLEQLVIARAHLTEWLPRACSWLREGAERGNAWLASDHHYMVSLDGSGITVDES